MTNKATLTFKSAPVAVEPALPYLAFEYAAQLVAKELSFAKEVLSKNYNVAD